MTAKTMRENAQEYAESIRNGESVIFHSEWCNWFSFLCLDGKFLVVFWNVILQKWQVPGLISLTMQHNLDL